MDNEHFRWRQFAKEYRGLLIKVRSGSKNPMLFFGINVAFIGFVEMLERYNLDFILDEEEDTLIGPKDAE